MKMPEKTHHCSAFQPSTSNPIKPVPFKRVYQIWKGNNKFFFGGRLVFGPDMRSLVFTTMLIVTPVISFCSFLSDRMIAEYNGIGTIIVALPAVVTVYIIILLLLTSARDPGIIPRNLNPPDLEDDGEGSSMSADWPAKHAVPSNFRPTKDVVVNGMVIKVKYCHTCMLYRPPRCSHCSICNNCVERFDHHCPWVGQCIGKRNYIFFFLFVSATTFLCLYVFAFCWVDIRIVMITCQVNLGKAFLKSPVAAILIFYTFIAAWFVGGLTAFHVYLILTNQTTYENFRYRYDGKMNPYNLGLARNIVEVFFSKIPKSRNNFRAWVKENALTPMGSSVSVGRITSPELPKKSFGVEMGGKRKAVVEEELEDVQNQIEGITRLERCGTQPRHTNWGDKANCEITTDLHCMDLESGNGHRATEREKINGVL